MNLFRIHIRPKGGTTDPVHAWDYCIENNILGVGWQIPTKENEKINWETYERRAIKKYGKIQIVKYIKDRVSKNDLIWTRDTHGHYYLARVLSEWKYDDRNPESKEVDIVNIFQVEIKKIKSVDEVPGKIIACFRGRRTIQQINDVSAITYSKMLWNELSKFKRYEIEKLSSVWSFITDEQAEDIVFLFLQYNGWLVVPNSRKKDTMSYEFYVINKSSTEKAIIQVKTGGTAINCSGFNKSEKVFLFQPDNHYVGERGGNIVAITKEELEKFIYDHKKIIPENIYKWFEIIRKYREN